MLQIHLALLDDVLMHLLAVVARAHQPGGYGPLIQATGGHERLGRTALAEPGEDQRHQVRRRSQPVEGRARGGGEGLATGRTAIPLLRLAMHADVPLSHLASGTAVRVMAELGLRVHRWPPLNVILLSQVRHVQQDARRTRFFSSVQSCHHG